MSQAIADITRIVNTSILQQLPDAFFQATGLATGIHNIGGELITTIPKENFCSFCKNMFFSREGHRRCVCSNSLGERRAYSWAFLISFSNSERALISSNSFAFWRLISFPDIGRNLRFRTEDRLGSALALEDAVVHLAVFPAGAWSRPVFSYTRMSAPARPGGVPSSSTDPPPARG